MALSTTRKFLSTPSARRATIVPENCNGFFVISIHALREEGDKLMYSILLPAASFLSTPSARRATRRSRPFCPSSKYFYPRPPRGGRLHPGQEIAAAPAISIHALREEGDLLRWMPYSAILQFLSTPSARRATVSTGAVLAALFFISIHALREEGDRLFRPALPEQKHFYPRPPRGGRPG